MAPRRGTPIPPATGRGGYALLAVLWISVGVAGLGALIARSARDAAGASRNRVALVRAEWHAEGCLARTQALLGAALLAERQRLSLAASDAWILADRRLAAATATGLRGCEFEVRPAGARLDVNAADPGAAAKALANVGFRIAVADSMAAALEDWMDADDEPVPLGAEGDWYVAAGRPGPTNRRIATADELRMVRGFETNGVASVLDVETGGVSLNHAPGAVLAALPGFDAELVEWVLATRGAQPLRSFADLMRGLPPSRRAAVDAALPQLAPLVTFEPGAWIVAFAARSGQGPEYALEVRLEKGSEAVHVTRRRGWIP